MGEERGDRSRKSPGFSLEAATEHSRCLLMTGHPKHSRCRPGGAPRDTLPQIPTPPLQGDTLSSILQMEKLSLRKPLDNLPMATQQVHHRVRTGTQASCIPSPSSDPPLLNHHHAARRSVSKAHGPSLFDGFIR